MPETPQLPIDDNTLFILLALRHQGSIEIIGLNSVYDWNVNYGRTVVNPDNEDLSIEEIAERGINWICDTYNIKQDRQDNKTVILKISENSNLESNLDDYLSDFNKYENGYYYNEERHKKYFYEFIKSRFPIVLEFSDKYFPYKFLPIDDIEKYKMIEYIGFLLRHKILYLDLHTFDFDTEKGVRKKVINLKSGSTLEIAKLFWNVAEGKEKEIMRKVLNIGELKKEGTFFSLYNGNKICLNSNITKQIQIPPRYARVFLYCLENPNEKLTINNYIDYYMEKYHEITDASIVRQYFPETSKMIKTKLDLGFNIISSCGEGEWNIKLEP